jgi:hypothetical protein
MYILLIFLIIYNLSLFGEIIDVQVLFNQAFCKSSCTEKLQKLFENIPAVESVEINQTQGSAQLKWKKGAPYDFSVIKRVMQHTGAGISYMRIKARGEIQSDKKNYYLVSTGDGSKFTLSQISNHQNTIYSSQNTLTRSYISDAMASRLSDLKNEHSYITISGPLYFYSRPVPTLIIESMKKDKKKVTTH